MKSFSRLVCFLVVMATLAFGCAKHDSENLLKFQEKLAANEKKIDELELKIRHLEADLSFVNNKLNELTSKLERERTIKNIEEMTTKPKP